MSRHGRGSSKERVVGGLHPVRELLRSGQTVTRVLIAESRDRSAVLDDILELARAAGVTVEHVDRRDLDARAVGLVHQGVLALATPFPYVLLADVVASAFDRGEDPFLVALDGVTDPHNLGSIARSAEAVGVHGLVVAQRRSAAVTPTVEKSAAGALAYLPVVQVVNLVRALQELRDAGVWSIGLDEQAGDELAAIALASEPCVLVVGGEGGGLSRLTRDRCDALARLPMRGRVASLNASVAAAVALYELRRLRG